MLCSDKKRSSLVTTQLITTDAENSPGDEGHDEIMYDFPGCHTQQNATNDQSSQNVKTPGNYITPKGTDQRAIRDDQKDQTKKKNKTQESASPLRPFI